MVFAKRCVTLVFAASLVVFGTGAKKKDPAPVAAPPPAAAAPAPAPEPEPEPEPPPPARNADFKVSITHADGTVKSGRVVRIERGQDRYGDEGWLDSGSKLSVSLDSAGAEVDRPWADIVSIDVKYGTKADIDCTYDSSFTPWMYICTLKTTSTAKTTDGKVYAAVSRYKWRFTFEDDSTEEFFLSRLPTRKQDPGPSDFENTALYVELQPAVLAEAQRAITRIAITK